LKLGRLSAAIESQTQQVKSSPGDTTARIFLFELLCFAGDLDRAEKQLDVVAHQSTEMQIGAEIYRRIIYGERARRAVFNDGSLPSFLTPPPEYAAHHLEALALQRDGKAAEAKALLEKSLSMQAAPSGDADGKAFSEFEDSDLFIGPFLELMVGDRYAWLPYEQLAGIELHAPVNLRDTIWISAKLEAQAGDIGEVYLPVLYPGTEKHANDAVRLGRMTDWLDVGAGLQRGAGQRVFLIDGEEKGMLEFSRLSFTKDSEEGAS